MLEPLRVLATSVGNDGFPAVLNALRAAGERRVTVVGADANPAVAGLFLADAAAVVPTRGDAAALLARLLDLCADYSVHALYPLSTEDQEFYARHADVFTARGVAVVTSPVAALRIANDKLAVLDACAPAGVPCPRYQRVESFAELTAAATGLGYPARPFVLKLNRGTGAHGVKVVDPALPPYRRLFDRDNLRVRYADIELGLADVDPFPALHLAEYLPGQEYSVDVLCHNGVPLAGVVRARLGTLYGLATHALIVDHPTAEKAAYRVIETLGLSYVVNVQFRSDEAGVPRLMEVNPRIPGTIGLSVAAGLNMPYLALKLALGEDLGPLPRPVVGTELIRHWSAVVRLPEAP